jgi:hypothetical protein
VAKKKVEEEEERKEESLNALSERCALHVIGEYQEIWEVI